MTVSDDSYRTGSRGSTLGVRNDAVPEADIADRLRLVRAIAARYRGIGLPVDDLAQEGLLGLVGAYERFDPARGDFDTFVSFRVRRAILNALTEQARFVRLPKQVVERRRAVSRAEASLTAANGRRPTAAEVARVTGIGEPAVLGARAAAIQAVSLDEPAFPDGTALLAAVPDPDAVDPELVAIAHDEAQLVRAAVDDLPERQRLVVARHFGLDRPAESLQRIAASLHLSPQRTRAIERQALGTLRTTLDGLR
jgi:RNA polymerase sigma factor (sigma-70 family)